MLLTSKLIVLLNRHASADATSVVKALTAHRIAADVQTVAGAEIKARTAALVAARTRRLVVGGGDGSISAAAEALAGSDVALGILPLGTLNHFARDLGIPRDLAGAARVVAAGQVRAVDLIELNGRMFVNNAAIGLYPLMVVDRESQQERLGRSKRLAMLVASARTLVRFHHRRLTLTIDGRASQVDTPLLFVGNNDYRLAMPGAGTRDRLDGGRLCVLVMRSKSASGFLAAATRALLGRSRSDELERIDGVSRLRVDSRCAHLTVAMDGETLRLAPPLDFAIRPRALTVIAPLPASPAPLARRSSTASRECRRRSGRRLPQG